jgi:hypothetical protein
VSLPGVDLIRSFPPTSLILFCMVPAAGPLRQSRSQTPFRNLDSSFSTFRCKGKSHISERNRCASTELLKVSWATR